MNLKFPLLKAKDIDVKAIITNVSGSGHFTLEKNSFVDMEILDKTVRPEGWQCSFKEIKGEVYCDISIYDLDKKEWVHKEGIGFKNAAFKWGIGQEIFTAPKSLKASGLTKDKTYQVSKMRYKNQKIIKLEISDNQGNIAYKTEKSIIKTTINPNKTISKEQEDELINLSMQLHGDNVDYPICQVLKSLGLNALPDIKQRHFESIKNYITDWDKFALPYDPEQPEDD